MSEDAGLNSPASVKPVIARPAHFPMPGEPIEDSTLTLSI
jgi:hypothetical protein